MNSYRRCQSMSDTPSVSDDSKIQRQRVLGFFAARWPPKDAGTLYRWGRSELAELGKEACLRAVLASYEIEEHRQQETPYDRSARRAAEQWVLNPNEDTRKIAGRVASEQTQKYSRARLIANMAGSNRRWPTAVGYGLTWGDPANVRSDSFCAICAAIESEILAWARGESDPVADRHRNDNQEASEPRP